MKNQYSVICFLVSCFFATMSYGQLKIGDNPKVLDNSALLEMESQSKGLLLPRMSEAQRDLIPSPATGLLIFNTTKNQLELNSGTPTSPAWVPSAGLNITSQDTARWNQLITLITQLAYRLDSLEGRLLELEGLGLASYVPKDSIIGWWSFNNTSKDLSGNGHDGDVIGATPAADRLGRPGYAYHVDSNQVIKLKNTSTLNPYPLSISLWYYAEEWRTNSSLLFKYSSGSWNGFGITLNNYNNFPCVAPFYLRSTVDRILGYYNEPAFDQFNIDFNRWYHFVFVVDEEGGKIYINGELSTSKIWTGTPGSTSNNYDIQIGGLADNWFKGIIDDVGIWNKALTPQEIKNLYGASY